MRMTATNAKSVNSEMTRSLFALNAYQSSLAVIVTTIAVHIVVARDEV